MIEQEKSTPKDVFLHLSVIAALYASIISFITIWFQYINVLFPDQLNYYLRSSLGSIRWASSVLVVAFPLYIVISWMLIRDFKKNPDKRKIKIRKWLLYFTLFIAALTIAIDLITLIFYFYSGELTVRFVLKVVVLLAVALAVFGYYLWNLKSDGEINQKRNRQYAWVASIIILASIIAGFFIVGSPATQRNIRFDEEKISDLQGIQYQTVEYWRNKEQLPGNLNDLENNISGFSAPVDPQTNEPYEYNILGDLSFELCANFKADSLIDPKKPARPRKVIHPYPGQYSNNWHYTQGKNCFQREIDPNLYKTEKPIIK